MKIGLITTHLALSESNYTLIRETNKWNSMDHEVVIFTSNTSSKVLAINGPVFNISQLSYFDNGVVISTDFQTTRSLIQTPLNANKFYYVYDLDWLYRPVHYDYVYEILSQIPLLVRSELHQKYIKNIFDLESQVVPFQLEKIWNLQDLTKINSFKPM